MSNLVQNIVPTKLQGKISDDVGKMILYVIWPFGAWIYSLRSAHTRSSYIIFFLFSLLLCWHMSPAGLNERYDDFLGTLDKFYEIKYTTDEILKHISHYFEFSISSPKEIYEDVVIWFSKSCFGDNYHFFFLLASIPIALCQLGSMRYITRNPKYVAGTLIGFLVIALFIFPRDIITTQNPRYATGFWYSVFITINCFFGNKSYWYLLLLFFAPLFHAALWLYVGFVAIVLCVNSFVKLVFLEKIAYGSILLSFIDFQFLAGTSYDFLPPSLSTWVTNYMSEDSFSRYSNDNASGFWWVGEIANFLLKAGYMIMMVKIIKSVKEKKYVSFYRFIICLIILINCIQFLPEISIRYFHFVKVYLVFAWFLLAYREQKDEWVIIMVGLFTLWPIMFRYGYVLGGALSINTPLDIFYMPLPYLVGKGLLW